MHARIICAGFLKVYLAKSHAPVQSPVHTGCFIWAKALTPIHSPAKLMPAKLMAVEVDVICTTAEQFKLMI